MTLHDLNSRIGAEFPKDIYSSRIINGSELYLGVNPENIMELSMYLNAELGCALVSLFASDERALSGNYRIYYTFAERTSGSLVILTTAIDPSRGTFLSIGANVYAAARYEQEIRDLFGLVPEGHPGLKRLVLHRNWPENNFPLRRDFSLSHRPETADVELEFTRIKGEGVFEIPVGPVHAGIIEPGHFRFSVAGEPIFNLEAQLYYVHKGIEKLCEGQSAEKCFFISERISGDETFTNSLAYCQSIEKIAGIKAPERAEYARVLFAELERLTSHFGDLAGICIDVAYGFAASQFNMLRNWAYGMADELCGMRFLRSVNKPGGVRKDFLSGKENSLLKRLEAIKKELEDTVDIIMHNSMFHDRVENTGILETKIALDLNAVGPPARASGIPNDMRKQFPYAAYPKLEFRIPVYTDGDVNSRMKVKIKEAFESISLIRQVIETIPAGKDFEPLGPLNPHSQAFGVTESPRGENVHWVMTDEGGNIFRYKIRTPSFCNWPALCHAVQGNIVPDFPLINKSFNLSYAGNDL
ncbi:MAG TPA: NADH-quinone oxidoreductase subunit C [Anaerovoracaceae bacterium]|nr:NADH-quinone oxidoreductase subunit C [Anaerovoracaceae bacterium]